MSDKDDLRYYEREWEKEHALRRQAEERAKRAEDELSKALEEIKLLEHRLERANQLLEEAEEAREKVAKEAAAAKQRSIQEMASAQQIVTELQRELDGIKARINQHDFWQREFAQLLAADLDFLDEWVEQTSGPEDWIAVFELWHAQILEGLVRLTRGESDDLEVQRLRQLILAQWVYLRWLEVIRASESGVQP